MLTVGKILKSERQKKNLTLKEIEEKIRVRKKYLSSIEKGDWSLFSSKVYISGIIRNYSNFLGLDPDKMLAFFRREYARQEDTSFKKRLSAKYITPQTRKVIFYLIIAMIAGFSYYFGYQVVRYLSPPKVEILSPDEEIFKRQDRVRVVGQTEKEAVVEIFGERIYQNKNGVFNYDFPLELGKNELIIEVEGANGKKTSVSRIYILEE
ncbi:MAG: helix-turn-helix domain-containing protein [Patescibacteria group bacterium]